MGARAKARPQRRFAGATARPRTHARFEGLVINLGRVTDERRTQARIVELLRQEGQTGWISERLGRDAEDFLVRPPAGRRVSVAAAWQLTHRLRANRDVARVEPAFETVGHSPTPRDLAPTEGATLTGGFFGPDAPAPADHQWSIKLCRIPEAWQLAVAAAGGDPQGKDILVAHPDTGFTGHPELDPPRVLANLGFNFFEEQADPTDPLTGEHPGHGTATGSVIMSGVDPNVAGAAPLARLVPLRVSDTVLHFSWMRLSRALYHAVDRQCHVVSMSLGGPFGSGALHDAVRFAVERGLILIAAAGNHWPAVVYPARYAEVIAASACNAQKVPWSGTARGPAVDITGPGESVWRALTRASGFSVEPSSGTSYATATVAGIAAMWVAFHGRDALVARYGAGALAGVFRELLMATAQRPPRWDTTRHGAGIADALALLRAPLPDTAPATGLQFRSQAGAADDPWVRVLELFPGADPERVRRAVLGAFGMDERAARTRLGTLVDEMLFHLSVDPGAREAILQTATARGRGAQLGSHRSATGRTLFRAASPALKRLLVN